MRINNATPTTGPDVSIDDQGYTVTQFDGGETHHVEEIFHLHYASEAAKAKSIPCSAVVSAIAFDKGGPVSVSLRATALVRRPARCE